MTDLVKVTRDNLEAAWQQTLQEELPDDVRAALE